MRLILFFNISMAIHGMRGPAGLERTLWRSLMASMAFDDSITASQSVHDDLGGIHTFLINRSWEQEIFDYTQRRIRRKCLVYANATQWLAYSYAVRVRRRGISLYTPSSSAAAMRTEACFQSRISHCSCHRYRLKM